MTGPKSCDQSLVTTTQEPETQFGKNNLVENVSYFIFVFYFQQLLSLVVLMTDQTVTPDQWRH